MRFCFTTYSCIGLALLAGCHPASPADAEEKGLPTGGLATLNGTWLLVPEASHADTLVYRRNTYRFRYRPGGRPGFRLGPNGRFTRYDLAPGGGLLAHDGTWTEAGQQALRIHLPKPAPAGPDYTLVLLSYQDGKLTLRRQ